MALVEPTQTVNLNLNAPVGAGLGSPTNAVLSINDTASMFENQANIAINGGTSSSPYPSTITVAGGPVSLTADVAYQFVRQGDRRGRTREPIFNQVPTTGLNTGLYTLHAHLFGVSLGYAF